MLGQCNSWLKKHVNTMMIWKVTIKQLVCYKEGTNHVYDVYILVIITTIMNASYAIG